ncbi:MAG: hypothetical protein K5777_07095 [Nitrosopumilus sp.]|nr:hypothetical protein [Nitrosopumilus sp.]
MNNPLLKYSATESILGYLYQFEIALLMLLERPNSTVSIESIDDISFEENDKTKESIQVKHHIKNKGNVTDASSDIWKTLNVWMDGLKELGYDDVQRILFTTETVRPNTIAYCLNRDKNKRDVSVALQKLDHTAKTSKTKENLKIYKKFSKLRRDDKEKFVNSIFILDDNPDIKSSRNLLIEKLRTNARPGTLNPFFTRVWETWINIVTSVLIDNTKKSIGYDEIVSHINDIRDQFTQESLPIDFVDNEPSKVEMLSFTDNDFVKQLELISASKPIIQIAIIEYWKAYQQRTRWVNDELLFDNELIKYEQRLINAWNKQFEKMRQKLGQNPSENDKKSLGWELFDWADNNNSLCIRDKCIEPYVIQGSFHMLADELRIGWHSDFLTKLKSAVRTASEISK